MREHVVRQLEQADPVRHRRLRLADPLGDLAEREAELVDQDGVPARLLDRRQILARDVLDEPEQQRVAVVGLAHDRRNRRRAPRRGPRASGARRRSARSRPRAAAARRPAGSAPARGSTPRGRCTARCRSACAAGSGSGGSGRRRSARAPSAAPPIRTSKPRPRPRRVVLSARRQAPSPPSSRPRRRASAGRSGSRADRGSAPPRRGRSAARRRRRRASPKCWRTSASTSADRRVRASTIVSRTPAIERLRVEPRLDQVDRLHELREALERVVLGLHRHDHAVGRGERVDRQRAERRRAVEQHEVEALRLLRARRRGSARRRRAATARPPRRRARASTERGRGSRTASASRARERHAVEQVVRRRPVRAHPEPGGRVRLRVEVDHERALARLGQAGREVDRRRRLADAALLIRKCVDRSPGQSSRRAGHRNPLRKRLRTPSGVG